MQFDFLLGSTAMLLRCPEHLPSNINTSNTSFEEIDEPAGLTPLCSVPQGTNTAPTLIFFSVEGPLSGVKRFVASNFKGCWSKLLQSGATW